MNTIELVKQYWAQFLAVLLIAIVVILWQSNQNTKKELEKIKVEQTASEQLKVINSRIDEINQREKELYPQIDANINDINKNIKDSRVRLTNIEKNQLKKEQVYEDFKKKTIQQISSYLLDSGYPNTILDR